jgi:hypothetical protein
MKDLENKVEEKLEGLARGKRGYSKLMAHSKRAGLWRVFWGLFFLAAAAAVLLSALNIFTFGGINISWLILGIFLAALAIASLFKLQWLGVFAPIAGLLTIDTCQTHYLGLSTEVIWPIWVAAVLLSIGFGILFHRSHGRWYHVGHIRHDTHTKFDRHHPDKHENVINQDDDSEVFVDVNMGATIKYVNTDDFQSAVLNCKLGSIKVYFDNAKIKGDSALVDINSTMSGIELFVPRNWRIIDSTSKTMSGIDEQNAPRFTDRVDEKTVTLTGSLTRSGIEITYI